MAKVQIDKELGVRAFSDELVEKVSVTLNNPSNNCCVVKVRKSRVCFECSKTIDVGTRCYYFNARFGKREWVCLDCLPEPNTVVERVVGTMSSNGESVFYSERYGFLGQRLPKERATTEELLLYKTRVQEDLDEQLQNIEHDDF